MTPNKDTMIQTTDSDIILHYKICNSGQVILEAEKYVGEEPTGQVCLKYFQNIGEQYFGDLLLLFYYEFQTMLGMFSIQIYLAYLIIPSLMEGEMEFHVNEWITDLAHPPTQYVAVINVKDVAQNPLNKKATFHRIDLLVDFNYHTQTVTKSLTTHAVTYMGEAAIELFQGRLYLLIG